jgi:hypothetical protein
MGYGVQILKGVFKIFKSSKAKPLLTVNNLLQTEPLLKMGKVGTGFSKYEFRIKPDIKMPVNPSTLTAKNPTFEITAEALEKEIPSVQGELGNVAIRLSEHFQKYLASSKEIISNVYKGNKISFRAKGANSIYSKLERVIKNSKILRIKMFYRL